MEIIISALGTKGDIHPLLAVAKNLKQRGYRTIFLTNPRFENFILKEGVEFYPVGTVEQYEKFHSKNEIWSIARDPLEIGFDDYFFPATKDAYNYVCENKDKNLFILTMGVNNGARIAADQYGLPSGIILLSPNRLWSKYSPPAPLCWIKPKMIPGILSPYFYSLIKMISRLKTGTKYIKKVHRKLNIKSKIYSYNYSFCDEKVLIGLFPEWFGMRPKDWPKNLKLTGFPLHDEVNEESRLKVNDFIGTKKGAVLFTTGTGVHNVSDFFREGRKICEQLGVSGIFTGGQIGKEQLDDSEYCLHVDYVDFENTLPQCKAVIHHGGVGTTAQAIRAGIPQLIRPLTFDQPDNANRIHKLGLGTFILPHHFSAETVTPVLKAMLDNARFNPNFAMYSADLRRSNSIAKACDLIESKIKEIEKQEQ